MASLSSFSFNIISSLVALFLRPRVAFLIMFVSRLLNRRWAFLVGIREVLGRGEGRASSSGVGEVLSFSSHGGGGASSSDVGEVLARRAGAGGGASSSGVGEVLGESAHGEGGASSSDVGEGFLA